MSHLNLSSAIGSSLRGRDLDSSVGSMSRWQRKAQDQGLSLLSSSSFIDNSLSNRSGLCITPHNKTPLTASFLDSSISAANTSKSPGIGKSPGRAIKLSIRSKTPTRTTPNTPNLLVDKSYQGDRFIPRRPTDKESDMAHHLVMKHLRIQEGTEVEEELTLQEKEYRARMQENLNDGQPVDQRFVHFGKRAPNENATKDTKVLFSATKESVKKNSTRHIPTVPERVLDAPELRDDYYLHLIDWSKNNHVVVALSDSVYIWNANDGSINFVSSVDPPDYICSLSWIAAGNILAIGLSTGFIELWDVHEEKLVRTLPGHESRVSTMKWNGSILTSGSRTGQIIYSDARIAEHITSTFNAHNQEICGLSWNNEGRLLGSGGNDNIVKIWDKRSTTPLYRLTGHVAAVKAVAWCPWQANVLATGGGTADKTIRLWNANSGTCTKEILTESQVSSIVFNSTYKELVSGHGFSNHELNLWKFPCFTKVTALTGHVGRVLDIVSSPDGQMVASAAGDETIRLWKIWPAQSKQKAKPRALNPVSSLECNFR